MSQDDLGEKIGITKRAISKIQMGSSYTQLERADRIIKGARSEVRGLLPFNQRESLGSLVPVQETAGKKEKIEILGRNKRKVLAALAGRFRGLQSLLRALIVRDKLLRILQGVLI